MDREPVKTQGSPSENHRKLDVTQLLQRQREVEVVFQEQVYRLTLTRNQKLILTK